MAATSTLAGSPTSATTSTAASTITITAITPASAAATLIATVTAAASAGSDHGTVVGVATGMAVLVACTTALAIAMLLRYLRQKKEFEKLQKTYEERSPVPYPTSTLQHYAPSESMRYESQSWYLANRKDVPNELQEVSARHEADGTQIGGN